MNRKATVAAFALSITLALALAASANAQADPADFSTFSFQASSSGSAAAAAREDYLYADATEATSDRIVARRPSSLDSRFARAASVSRRLRPKISSSHAADTDTSKLL